MGQVNRISQSGLDLIKSFEGLRRRSSKLADGGWIVGYGHTRSAREGIEVTEREAEYLLRYDLQETERMVADIVRAPLHQNEFDALVSLAWNIGEDAFRQSDVLKYVNSGEMLAAAESFGAWRKANVDGHLIVLDALVRRRAAEKNLFLSHPSGAPAAPSLVVRPQLDTAASVLALANGALSLENRITEEAKAAPPAALLNSPEPDLSAANSNSQAENAPETIEETTREIGNRVRAEASIWDASGGAEYEELTELDEDDDAYDGIDDTLLAAAIAASNLSRRDDEAEIEEPAAEVTEEVMPAFEDAETVEAPEEEVTADSVLGFLDETNDPSESVQETDSAGEAVTEAEAISDAESFVERESETEFAGTSEHSDADIVTVTEDVVMDSIDNALVEESVMTEVQETVEEASDVDAPMMAAFAAIETAAEEEAEAAIEEAIVTDEVGDLLDAAEQEDDDAYHVEVELVEEAAEVAEATSGDMWQDEGVDADGEPRRVTIVDPMVVDHFPDEDNGVDAELAHAAVSGGRKTAGGFWFGVFPFILLALLGAAMCVFGVLDWAGLIGSEQPVADNDLYAGPFLTLIGGFGLIFGVYFMIRKLSGVED